MGEKAICRYTEEYNLFSQKLPNIRLVKLNKLKISLKTQIKLIISKHCKMYD